MAGQIINKVAAGGGTHLISPSTFFTCDTAAATAAKIAKAVDTNITSATIEAGTIVWVKFTNTNTAGTPTLTLQTNTGTELKAATSIKLAGNTTPSTTDNTAWGPGSVVSFIFDGTNWTMIDAKYYYDSKVTQVELTSPRDELPILLAYSEQGGRDWAQFSSGLKYSVDTINGTTVGNLIVDKINGHGFSTSINAASASSDNTLPTVSAVAAYVAESIPEEVVISDTEPSATDTNTKIWVQV